MIKRSFVILLVLFTFLFTASKIEVFANESVAIPTPDPPVTILHYWDGGIVIVLPDKTEYIEGEYLDITGLKVYGTSGVRYSDGTSQITYKEEMKVNVDLLEKPLSMEDTVVTVTGRYSLVGMNLTGTFNITVKPKSDNLQTAYSYELNELSASVISGETINIIPQNTSFIVDVSVTKTQERNEKDFVFVAVYDTDGALLSLDYVKADFPLNTECSFGFNIPSQDKQIGSIKAYVLNSFTSPEPLAESKTLTFMD